LREEFVGWGTVRGLRMKRRDRLEEQHLTFQLTFTARISQSFLGVSFPSVDTRISEKSFEQNF
jgi:hypothetical protein